MGMLGMCVQPRKPGSVLSPSQSWGIRVPAGVWLCVGVVSGGRGAAGVTEQRFWSEQLLDQPCVASSCSASPASWALISPKARTSIAALGPQAGFLKGSSAIWWEAGAVPGTGELGLDSHLALPFRTPLSGGVTTALDRPQTEGWYLSLKYSILMDFGFMFQGGMAGQSVDGLMEDRLGKVRSPASGSTNLGPISWATSLCSDFSSVQVADCIYPARR